MKMMFAIGIALLVLGIVSFIVPIPHTEREGISAGGVSIGIQTRHSERVAPIVGCALLLAGAGLMVAGRSAVRA
jgi:hypothetical protein